jgi:ABC-type multidrug transport system permease subunit
VSALWTVAAKELKLLLREPAAVILLFVLPAVFIFILAVALQGVFSTEESVEKLDIVVVNLDRGDVGKQIIEGLGKQGDFRVITEVNGRPATLDDARKALTRGDTNLAVFIPEDATEAAELRKKSAVEIYADPALTILLVSRLRSELDNFACLTTLDRTGRKVDEIRDGIDKLKDANDRLREAVDKLDKANRDILDVNDRLAAANETLVKANDKLLAAVKKMKRALGKVKELQDLAKAEGIEIPGGYDVAEDPDMKPPEKEPKLPAVEKPEGPRDMVEKEDLDIPEAVDIDADEILTGELTLKVMQKYYGAGEIKAIPNSVQQTVPGWTLFAIFWISQLLALNLLAERLSGAYRRSLVSPMGAATFFAGKILPYFGITMIQAAAMAAIGVFALPLIGLPPLELKNPGALLFLTVIFSLVSIGFGFFLAAVSKTLFFAAVLAATLMVIMAALGGIMVPTFVMPRALEVASLFVPHGWALEGYLDVLLRGHGIMDVMGHAAMLCLFGLVFYGVALLRFRSIHRRNE